MKLLAMILLAATLLACACKKEDVRKIDETYNPVTTASKFTNPTDLTNPYLLFAPGKKYIYEGQTTDGLERVEIQRLTTTRVVNGITCIIVNDKVWLEGVLIEDTDDWYAQDNDGNVWYFGEEVDNFNADGSFKDTHGSWEAGVDGAKAGIVMPDDPKVGMAYRQEYYFNEAEDEAEVMEVGVTVTTPFGTFENCIKTRDFTDLEPDVNENKIYAPGIGLVKEINLTDNEEAVLIDIEE